MTGCASFSTDMERFVANMESVDDIVNSDDLTITTPGGQTRTTLTGYDAEFEAAIGAIGWVVVDSFAAGATLTTRNQALRYAATGELYRWDGALPKVVPPGSTPASSGGTGVGAWMLVSSISNQNVSHLKALPVAPVSGVVYNVVSFYDGWAAVATPPAGGGPLVFNSTLSKSNHNGVTHYSPESLAAWAGTQSDIATLLNWTGSGSGLWVRTDVTGAINLKMAGAVGNDSANDTLSVQAAVNVTALAGGSYALYIPEGVYKLTSTINIITALRAYGEGCSPYVTNTGNRGGGSWLHFAHSGKGLNVDGVGMLSGVYFEKFGTFRDQPTPAPGWAPNNHDFDIYVDNADVTLDEITLLNPTKGFKLTNTQAGRLTIKRLRGQPLQVGIDIDVCYDLPQIENVHFWPYWQDSMHVHNYTMQNLDAIFLRRVDNPQLLNIFTIFARAGVRITQSAAGTVSKMMLVNGDFDRGTYGLWIDETVTSMTTSKIVNFSCYGEAAVAGSKAILIQGSNCKLQIENIGTENHHQNAIRVEGTGNIVSIGNADFTNWNQSGVGFPAVEALNGNVIQFAQPATTTGGGGAAVYEASTGTIYADDLWIPHSTTVTSLSGTITTVGTVSIRYKRRGRLVDVVFDITITTNGTGAGDVRFTLPFAATGFSNGAGREVALTGNALSVQATSASINCQIIKYDNTYPASSGSRLVGSISYRV